MTQIDDPTLPHQVVDQPLSLKPHSATNVLSLILALGLLISLAINGVLLYQLMQLAPNPIEAALTGPLPTPVSTPIPTPTPELALASYQATGNQFSFRYPSTWILEDENWITLTPKADHEIMIDLVGGAGFGYCFGFGEPETIEVDGITGSSRTGQGVGDTESCAEPQALMQTKGNTTILVPYISAAEGSWTIIISYTYPIDEQVIADDNLKQLLAEFEVNAPEETN